MLIANRELSQPVTGILAMVAAVNGNNPAPITHQTGIYEVGHFGSSDSMRGFEDYPKFEPTKDREYRHSYGVCDDVTNLLAVYPELESSDREFVVSLTPVLRVNQSSDGGWRWHKWGEYIGAYEPQHEYLYDETIDKVYCFHIYEKV